MSNQVKAARPVIFGRSHEGVRDGGFRWARLLSSTAMLSALALLAIASPAQAACPNGGDGSSDDGGAGCGLGGDGGYGADASGDEFAKGGAGAGAGGNALMNGGGGGGVGSGGGGGFGQFIADDGDIDGGDGGANVYDPVGRGFGGGGGGGGGTGQTDPSDPVTGAIRGGSGGRGANGGLGADLGGGGGGGGGGGFGLTIGAPGDYEILGTVEGGDGGAGGDGGNGFDDVKTAGGGGGAGAAGISATAGQITIGAGAAVTGGNGGVGGFGKNSVGNDPDADGGDGDGGAGILATNERIITGGTIAGGLSGNGVQAAAIIFGGGANYLTFQNSDSGLIGAIVLRKTASLTFDQPMDTTLASAISGKGSVAKTEAGVLVLSGANTYTGGTTITAGTLQLGDGGASGSIRGDVANDGVLAFNRSDAYNFQGVISGIGALRQDGSGTTTLAARNSYSGSTTVNGGALKASVARAFAHNGDYIVNGGTLDLGNYNLAMSSLSGTGGMVALGSAVLTVNQATNTSFAGALSGSGDFTKSGTGTLTLSGDSSAFAGDTAVSSGALRVNGVLGGDVAARDNSALTGSGRITGSADLTGGGVLAGTTGQTLRIDGHLVMDDSSLVNVALGNPSGVALFDVGGDLTLDGTLTVTDAGGFGAGVYRLFDYAGDGVDQGIVVEPLPGGVSGTLQMAVAHQVNLVVDPGAGDDDGEDTSDPGPDPDAGDPGPDPGPGDIGPNPDPGDTGPTPAPEVQFWNGSGNDGVGGGAGVWSAGAATNWTDANGTRADAWASRFVVFQNNPAAVTVDGSAGAVTTTGMQFVGSGWTVSGDALTLAGDDGVTTIRVGDGSAAGAADRATIASELAGASRLVKDDLGTLVVTGANSYTGGTTVKAGVLQIGDHAAAGSILGDVAVAAELRFARSDTMTFDGVISGAGTLRQIGAGLVNLTGHSEEFTGSTFVESGTLAVNGTLGGSLDVLSAGRLQGNGTVGDTIVRGTVAPGNSIGTLNVAGGITFLAGSAYEVEVNAASEADRVVASGAATIEGGTVKVLAGEGVYKPRTDYTILTAGNVAGRFADVTSNMAFLDPSLAYDAGHVYLRLTRNDISFASIGATPNQIATGRATETLGWDNPVFAEAVNLSADQAREAFDQLSGEIHSSARTAMLENSRFLRNAVSDRLRSKTDDDTGGAWGQVIGSWGHTDGDGEAAKLDRATGGLLMGVDLLVGDTLRLGAVGGYDQTDLDVDARASSGRIGSFHLGGYAGGQWGRAAIRTGVAYSRQEIQTSRGVAFPGYSDALHASYDGGTAQAFGEVGYGIDVGASRFEPFANLAYVRAYTAAFTETGGAAKLSGDKAASDAVFSTLGLRVATTVELGRTKATLSGNAGWRHALGDTTSMTAMRYVLGGNAFATGGLASTRDAAAIDASLAMPLSHNGTIGVAYSGQFGSRLTDQTAKATLSFSF